MFLPQKTSTPESENSAYVSASVAGSSMAGSSLASFAPESYRRANVEASTTTLAHAPPLRHFGLPAACELAEPRDDRPDRSPWAGGREAATFRLHLTKIQAQAELLERQARKDQDEEQRLVERHSREMLETRSFRVTQACEHCRNRKAKCSGQQPCQRCSKQGKLCSFSKQPHRDRLVIPLNGHFDVPSQASRPSGYLGVAHDRIGPMRMVRSRARAMYDTSPYGARSEPAPHPPTLWELGQEVANASASSSSISGLVSGFNEGMSGSYSLPHSPLLRRPTDSGQEVFQPFGAGLGDDIQAESSGVLKEESPGAFQLDHLVQGERPWSSASNLHFDSHAPAYSTASTPSALPVRSLPAVRQALYSPGSVWNQSTPAEGSHDAMYFSPIPRMLGSWDTQATHGSFLSEGARSNYSHPHTL